MNRVCLADYRFYMKDGSSIGGGRCHLPGYLDWLPIQSKMFWFLARGLGEPDAAYVLLNSQGEQMIGEVVIPLQNVPFNELMEIDYGLESLVAQHAQQNGLRRTPRNQ